MQSCPRCQRTNPDEAAFCYFDGTDLRALPLAGVAHDPSRLPHEFVFPSGRRCKTYDELAAACQDEWTVARDLLIDGAFRQFLTAAGRLDLAKAAEETRGKPDPDVALDSFLARLPTKQLAGPRLELEPRRLMLGRMRSGETMDVELRVINLGKGLLLGTVAVAGGEAWLRLDGSGIGPLNIKATRDQLVTVHVDTKSLSSLKEYKAHLTVITNGGIVEVPVRLTVAAYPFEPQPYRGAAAPRDLAVRMRNNPKPAVALLEGGEVQRWFEHNHWNYPVNGPTAKGMAAVQQFFESMGLARAPTLKLSDTEVHCACTYPTSTIGQTTLYAVEKKWIYARMATDAPWLRCPEPTISGPQKATFSFEIDSSQLATGRHEGTIQVVGNGGQTLPLKVSVEVTRPGSAIAPPRRSVLPPPAPITALPEPVPPRRFNPPPVTMPAEPAPVPLAELATEAPAPVDVSRPPRRGMHPALAGALIAILLRLLLAGPADIYARVLAAPGNASAGSFAAWREAPMDAAFVKHFVLATWWLGAVAGLVTLARRGSHWGDVPCGLIAGAAAGVIGMGTLACLLPALDFLPRLFWQPIAVAAGSAAWAQGAWLGTAGWLAVAALCWSFMGALVGLFVGRNN
jgi:hypothetical protein